MLAFILVIFIAIALIYLFFKHKEGYILSFFLVYPYILPFLFEQIGIEGFAIFTRYSFFLLLFIITYKYCLKHFIIIKKEPIIYSVILLIITILFINHFSINKDNPIVLLFQRDAFIYTFVPFFIALFLLNNENIISDFVNSLPYWGLLFAVLFIAFFDFNQIDFQDRFTFVEKTGVDTIASSRLFGISLIASIMLLINKFKINFFLISLIIINIIFILITGQRGTILGLFLALFIFILFSIKRKNILGYLLFSLATFLIFYLQIIDLTQFEVFSRFSDLQNYKEYERFYDYPTVWRIFGENSYFYGEGSLGYVFLTGRVYPHNIILESISDYGLIGLISILSIIICGLYYCFCIFKNDEVVYQYKIIANIWVMILCSVLVSGNIVSNALFFIFTGALVSCYRSMINTQNIYNRLVNII